MFRICCLRKGETARSIAKEVLYRRYLKFYLSFHIFYVIITLIEYILFLSEDWSGFYLSSFIFLLIDCIMIIGLLLRPEQGPDKRVVYFAFATTCLTLLLYIISRLYAFFSPHTSNIYSGFLVIFLLFFIFTKSRCMYHIWRFNRFNSFEKTTTRLSNTSPIEINEESWSHNDGFEVGAGNTKYITMKDNVDINDRDHTDTDRDTITDLPIRSVSIDRANGLRSDSMKSDGSVLSNDSLDLGNVNISINSDKSSPKHSFHAVPDYVD